MEFGSDADLVLEMVTRARESQRKSSTLDPGNTFDIEVAARFFQRFQANVNPLRQKVRDAALIDRLEESTERAVRRRERRRRYKIGPV